MSLLFLNSISGGEILVILLIILMVFGADSIPSIARNLGRGIRQIKDATQEIQRDIANSANNSTKGLKEMKDDVEKIVEGKEFKNENK
ncbi:twin-arginine translocase TatA/TatE family subunit [Parvicella tangerina]|uniref:Sec-independent protein translocase protein TatA n=1 Tax=Parvicella tangerina TaxID=2829795 RepID=A0A916JKD7_9FLAO|nr:twin-arginine translocase TatA/TatE family subunit [Parvicella tangerina]CAG5078100.1 Sec-independent protein translocase protein TatA [Parvicella tangerina]